MRRQATPHEPGRYGGLDQHVFRQKLLATLVPADRDGWYFLSTGTSQTSMRREEFVLTDGRREEFVPIDGRKKLL